MGASTASTREGGDGGGRGFGAALAAAALGPAILLALATVACGIAAVPLSGHRPLLLHVYLAAAGALGVWAGAALLRAALPTAPSALERALPRPPPPPPPLPELQRAERDVGFAAATAFDFHVRLRRPLREIAARRLVSRHGIDMERDPAAARRVLGDEVWDALHGEAPANRLAPGPGAPRIRRLIDALEEL